MTWYSSQIIELKTEHLDQYKKLGDTGQKIADAIVTQTDVFQALQEVQNKTIIAVGNTQRLVESEHAKTRQVILDSAEARKTGMHKAPRIHGHLTCYEMTRSRRF